MEVAENRLNRHQNPLAFLEFLFIIGLPGEISRCYPVLRASPPDPKRKLAGRMRRIHEGRVEVPRSKTACDYGRLGTTREESNGKYGGKARYQSQ